MYVYKHNEYSVYINIWDIIQFLFFLIHLKPMQNTAWRVQWQLTRPSWWWIKCRHNSGRASWCVYLRSMSWYVVSLTVVCRVTFSLQQLLFRPRWMSLVVYGTRKQVMLCGISIRPAVLVRSSRFLPIWEVFPPIQHPAKIIFHVNNIQHT